MTYAAEKIAEAAESGDQAAARYWTRIRDLVNESPPLTLEQRGRLAALLRPATGLSPAGTRRPPRAA